jgi:hypothetical protein
MRCTECEREPIGRAWGWLAFRGDAVDDEEPVLVFYCPTCAADEFGDYLSLPRLYRRRDPERAEER